MSSEPTAVRIFDTTLRDGEQSIGVVFTPEEKFEIACALSDLGISRIEAGFPRVSEADSQAVKRILDEYMSAAIWGFSRAMTEDLDALIELGTTATVIEVPTSEIKMAAYGLDRDKVRQRATGAIRHAVEHGMRVIFFPVDGTRTDPAFLRDIYAAGLDAGASEVAVVDTIGACAPETICVTSQNSSTIQAGIGTIRNRIRMMNNTSTRALG